MNTPEHYDNTNGSLYKFAHDHNLNAWEFDIIKRVSRCRKKGNFKEDLEKTKHVIDLYLKEFDQLCDCELEKHERSKMELDYNNCMDCNKNFEG